MCEWGSKDNSSEKVEREETGGGEFGLTGVTIEISDRCVGS